MDVVIYTTPTCGYCRQAKEYLKARKVPFVEKDVAVDPVAAREMVQRSGQRGVPVLVMDGEVIVGFDRRRIDQALSRMASQTQPARLGAAISDAATIAPRYGLPITQGAYVGRVNDGSPAQRAGMQAGDVIIALGGRRIQNADDVQAMLKTFAAGQSTSATVWRAGQQIQLQIVFA
jgi:glutaredoxin 3